MWKKCEDDKLLAWPSIGKSKSDVFFTIKKDKKI